MAYVVSVVCVLKKSYHVITGPNCAIFLIIAQDIYNPIAESIALLHQSVESLPPVIWLQI